MEKKTFKKEKNTIKGCLNKYGNKKTSAMSWMNVAKCYGDLFYTTKSLPGFFWSEVLLTAKKNRLFSNEISLTAVF